MKIQKRFLGQFIWLCMFLVFIVFSMIGGFLFQITKYKDYSSEISGLNKEIEEADKEIEELKAIESNQNENDLEEIARIRLNMVKPNEIVYFTEKEIESK